ncbi:MAG: ASKHA domain-containing protein [bacterium]|nr:ASKHA domain-containing protein [bacterium]
MDSKICQEMRYTVHFYPDDVKVVVYAGTTVLQAAIDASIYIPSSCGGEGLCGRCKIIIDKQEVLACRTQVDTDLEVRIPPVLDRKRLAKKRVVLPIKKQGLNPITKKLYLELPFPKPGDNIDDLYRLIQGIKKECGISPSIEFPIIQKLSKTLREERFKVTVSLLDVNEKPTIVNVEPGDTRSNHYSIALDIGTTSIYAQLLDLEEGKVLAETSCFNPQIVCGEDIISRIVYSLKPGNLKRLQELVVKAINEIVEDLTHVAKIEKSDINQIVVAGNTTMIHLLLGIDPRYIRESPYTPTCNFIPPVRAKEIGIDLPPYAYIYIIPSIASFIGGDITSGILASKLYETQELSLYIDIGTNGEIVLGNREMLVACSCSAGPAFEGGGVSCGTFATFGAIERVRIDRDYEPEIETIGGVKPKGICGSGLIDTLAELLMNKIISQNGKFNEDLKTKRVRKKEGGFEYVICWKDENDLDHDIVLTEVDIDNLMRAKAAIYAGISLLLEKLELTLSDISKIIISGNFGQYIDLRNAHIIGLFPEVSLDRFEYIGNGSLLGARLCSFSKDMLNQTREIANSVTNIELSDNPRFYDEYLQALFLPHTNMEEFPGVSEKLKKRA